jgi:uncharacterized protein YndB with AHSA1/START domain
MRTDVSDAIGAVTRGVERREHDGEPAYAVRATRLYNTSIEDLWDALTNAERVPRWFLPVTGDLRPGGHYQLEGNAGGTISRCEPPQLLALTWEFGGNVSWVTVRLEAESDETTRLELEHLVRDDEHWKQYGPGATGVGWDMALLGLAEHLLAGSAIDPAEAASWMASDEGKLFMRGSGADWRRAHAAGGDVDEAEARAMAGRTIAAYTGEEAAEDS